VAYFTFTNAAQVADGSIVKLAKLPPGRIRVFPGLSYITISALGASRTVNLGHAAYTGIDGVEVAADPDEFWSAVDCSAAVSADFVEASGVDIAKGHLFQSQDGVVIEATVAGGTLDAAETMDGFIVFAADA